MSKQREIIVEVKVTQSRDCPNNNGNCICDLDDAVMCDSDGTYLPDDCPKLEGR
jgi:hypothetical protein